MKTWGEKTKAWLKKHCLTLTLLMTTKAENLRIRTGHGNWYGLKLLESDGGVQLPEALGKTRVHLALVWSCMVLARPLNSSLEN